MPSATTRRPECGLFILGLSCRHSSTFFHRSGCPSPAHVSRPQPLPEAPKLGGKGGLLFQPKMPCLSPSASAVTSPFSVSLTVSIFPICLSVVFWCLRLCVSLSLSPRLSASLWACASVSLTQEFGAPVFRCSGLSPALTLCMALAPCPLPGSFGLYQTGMTMALTGSWGLSETGAPGAWPYSNLQLHKGLGTLFFFFLLPKVSARS